jgi:hypothetical protein
VAVHRHGIQRKCGVADNADRNELRLKTHASALNYTVEESLQNVAAFLIRNSWDFSFEAHIYSLAVYFSNSQCACDFNISPQHDQCCD